jgi:hypothetical protein
MSKSGQSSKVEKKKRALVSFRRELPIRLFSTTETMTFVRNF